MSTKRDIQTGDIGWGIRPVAPGRLGRITAFLVILSAAKDLTPVTRSVSAVRVWSFGEILRYAQDDKAALRTTGVRSG